MLVEASGLIRRHGISPETGPYDYYYGWGYRSPLIIESAGWILRTSWAVGLGVKVGQDPPRRLEKEYRQLIAPVISRVWFEVPLNFGFHASVHLCFGSRP